MEIVVKDFGLLTTVIGRGVVIYFKCRDSRGIVTFGFYHFPESLDVVFKVITHCGIYVVGLRLAKFLLIPRSKGPEVYLVRLGFRFFLF